MIKNLLKDINQIYIAYGATDFRKQAASLCSIIQNSFNMDPYAKAAFIFCNRKRTSIKVLCYDKNGFVLAQKTLIDTGKMKFKWPRNSNELKNITKQQLDWLLCGLEIEQKKSFKDIVLSPKNTSW